MAKQTQAKKRKSDPALYDDFSVPVDHFLSLPSDKPGKLAEEIAAEIEKSEDRNKRSEGVRAKFLHSIRIIILNLLYIQHRCPDAMLGISLNNNDIQPKDRYSCHHISVNTYQDAYNGLLSCGYLSVALEPIIGDQTKKGRRTRIVATDKMNKLLDETFGSNFLVFGRTEDEETIRLKDTNKEPTDYQDNDFTRRARNNLTIINNKLQRFWYDIWVTDAEFKELAIRLRQKNFPEHGDQSNEDEQSILIDLTARRLYRVFNNGDFEQGGRFYGGWWQQIPRDVRKYITIDTKQTVELDFANLHPWILYARKGIYLDLSTYDAYKVSDKIDRKYSKLAFNMLINAKRKPNPPEGFDEQKAGASWNDILDAVIAFHPDIAEFIASGEGVKLQNRDAEMAEGIMLHFAGMNYPCLPLHDSFIVHHALKDELKSRMMFEFQRLYGQEIKVDQKPEFTMYEGIAGIEDRTGNFDPETLFNEPEYKGYELRWSRWLEHRQLQ